MALKVLATFELSWGTIAFHRADFIQFQVFGKLHRMSLIEFSIHLGLYDAEFTRTITYDVLLTSRSVGKPLGYTWRRLSSSPVYDPSWTKATMLLSSAL